MNAASAPHKRNIGKLLAFVAVLLYVLLFVPGMFSPVVCAAVPLVLDRAPSYELAGHIERFDDLSARMTFEEMLHPENRVAFKPLKGNLNDGYSHKAVWLRFTLTRTLSFPAEAWVRFGPPYLDYVTAYIQTAPNPSVASSYSRVRLGDHIPAAERPVLDPDFLAPVFLPEGRTVTVYVRVQSITPLSLTATVQTEADQVSSTNKNILTQGSYLTIILVIAMLNLIFFFRIGDQLFLYFSLFAIALFINYLSISGILILIMPGSVHLVSDYFGDIGMSGSILLFCIFLQRLFAPVMTTPIRWYLEFMAVMAILTTLADPIGYYVEIAPITSLGVLCLFFVVIWLSIQAVRKQLPGRKILFVAFAISNLGYFLHFVKMLGLMPFDWWNINYLPFSLLLNILLITLALVERMRETEIRTREALRESEQRFMEVQIERLATERQKRFLATISHEYRTPLSIIRSSLDIMELQRSDQYPENRSELDKMKRSVRRLVEVMDVSLEKSRLSDSREKEGAERTLVAPFMASEIEEVRALWPKRTFIFTILLTDHAIDAEQHYLTTALFNLFDNAQKYSLPDSPIEIDCHGEGEEVVIRIRNQSNDILTNETEELFKKYQRGSNSNNTNGSGLGLWLVREIIQRHNGTVTLEKSGHHVVVTVRLPLADTVEKYTKDETG
ncbi:MAG: GHKL domain-containing protein [Chlorobium sp.]|nr:MAG: GHKL domain-containing protein [Chlorobium sp.]